MSETVLQKVAEHAYNKYLGPKIRPFCACSTVATMASQIEVRTTNNIPNLKRLIPLKCRYIILKETKESST